MSGLVGRGIPRSDFFWIAAITDERTERRNGATLPCGKKLGGGIVGVGVLGGHFGFPVETHTARPSWYKVLITTIALNS